MASFSPGLKKEQLTLEFVCKQDALLKVLNDFATHERVIDVKSVTVRKTDPDVLPPPPPPLDGGSAPKVLTKMQRIVSGRERAAPLSVTMVLDVYWLEPPKPETEDAPVS